MKTVIGLICLLCFALPAAGQWNFDNHSISLEEIQSGGPPKDGIPACEYVMALERKDATRKEAP